MPPHESDLNTAQEIPLKKFIFEKITTVLLMLAAGSALGKDDAAGLQIVNLSFNEGSGAIANAPGAILNHGDMKEAGWSREGVMGHCAELAEEGEYIEVAHSESLKSITTELTIDLWAYFDLEKLKGKSSILVTKSPGGGFGHGYILQYIDEGKNSRALAFYLAESWKKRAHHVHNNAIQTTGWHHITVTYSAEAKEVAFFVDGLKVNAQTTNIERIAPNTFPLIIGATLRDYQDHTRVNTFLGRLDEVKVWSKALTAEDIQDQYGHLFVKSSLVSPEHLATVSDATPTLTWTPAEDGTEAILELSSTPGFVPAKTFRQKRPVSSYQPDEPLATGVWYWRVFSTDASGKPTSGTKTWAFVVASRSERDRFTKADTTPPVVTGVRPYAWRKAVTTRPKIIGTWSDNESLDLTTARLYLDDRDMSSKAVISKRGLTFTPDADLGKGKHTVRIEIQDQAGNRANGVRQSFSVGDDLLAEVEIRSDRRMYVNDKPFFPLLYYHTLARSTDEEMVDWGWNVRHVAMSSPDLYKEKYGSKEYSVALTRFLEDMSRFGKLLLLDFAGYYSADYHDIVPLADTLRIVNGYQRVMGLTLDEPNSHPEGGEWARDLYTTARSIGEKRPVIYLLNSPSSASLFGQDGVGDAVVNDIYPYPSQPAVMVAKATEVGRELVDPRKPVWLYVQSFDSSMAGKSIDTLLPEERSQLGIAETTSAIPPGGIRCMMYLALVHDVTGLAWWIHHPGFQGHGGYHPALKRELLTCMSQVRHLAPMLLAPDAPVPVTMEPNDLGLHLKAKTYRGHTYILAVNPQEDLPVFCRFVLPEGKTFTKIDVLFENRSFRPVKATNAFEDLFAPREAHVYKIDD